MVTVAEINDKLPPETLIHIFSLLQPSLPDLGVQLVCRYWRDLVLASPAFWHYILCCHERRPREDTEPYLSSRRLLIERSSPLPFHLDIERPELKLPIVTSHAQRLGSIKLVLGRYFYDVLRDFLDLDLPALEVLTLEYNCRHLAPCRVTTKDFEKAHRFQRPVNRFLRLRKLKSHGFYFIPALAFPSLTTLSIGAYVLSLNVFLESLAGCTNLETLDLQDWRVVRGDNAVCQLQSEAASWTVNLPHLKDFMITTFPGEVQQLSGILNTIAFPSTTRLALTASWGSFAHLLSAIPPPCDRLPLLDTLTLEYDTIAPRPLYPGETHLFKVSAGTTGKDSTLCVRIGSTSWHARGHEHLPQYRIAPCSNGCPGLAFDIVRLFSSASRQHTPALHSAETTDLIAQARLYTSSRLTTFKVQIGKTVVSEADWHILFAGFPALTTLDVQLGKSCRHLLRVLLDARDALPVLNALAIANEGGSRLHEQLVRVVESRAAFAARLQRLTYRATLKGQPGPPMSSARVQRLKALVEELDLP